MQVASCRFWGNGGEMLTVVDRVESERPLARHRQGGMCANGAAVAPVFHFFPLSSFSGVPEKCILLRSTILP